MLAYLIKRTIIPANHDEIVAAWNEALINRDFQTDRGDYGVPESVMAEKARIECQRTDRSGG